MAKTREYGRGKFKTHPNYIEYMKMIVAHPNYKGMPNAQDASGHINWQVSSGKTTSFYKDYLARFDWWIAKADSLGLSGKGNSNERFSIAARKIHPSGYRTCRLCGEDRNVGYFYTNHVFTNFLNKNYEGLLIEKTDTIADVINNLSALIKEEELKALLNKLFPERARFFAEFGYTSIAFEKSNFLRSTKLSPGYMCNPPDRLEGFHDYCVKCRKKNDPGRHDKNMRTYNHDRRTFEWWAEGDWMSADTLYNLAGEGVCLVDDCGKKLKKISPDHIGPLACGFKQTPHFLATCPSHNSSKNRRLRMFDVNLLVELEKKENKSMASWQIRNHWNINKVKVKTDSEATELSHSLRSLQDMYLRVLKSVKDIGHIRFLAGILRPELAFNDVTFNNLDTSTLTYVSYTITENNSDYRKSMSTRSVRIAFDELEEYVSKPVSKRRLMRSDFKIHKDKIDQLLQRFIETPLSEEDKKWNAAINDTESTDDCEKAITNLLTRGRIKTQEHDNDLLKAMTDLFDTIGAESTL